jgi:type IV secretory pathway VirB9-like protein
MMNPITVKSLAESGIDIDSVRMYNISPRTRRIYKFYGYAFLIAALVFVNNSFSFAQRHFGGLPEPVEESPAMSSGGKSFPDSKTDAKGMPKSLGMVRDSFLEKNNQDMLVRRVVWKETTTPYIRLGLNVQTLIVLPKDEIIERVIKVHNDIVVMRNGTETNSGRLSLPDNVLGVRPKGEFLEYDTNLQVITESGRIYTFWLVVDKYDSDHTPDVKVYIDRATDVVDSRREIENFYDPYQDEYFSRSNRNEHAVSIIDGKAIGRNVKMTKSGLYEELSEALPDYIREVTVPNDINTDYFWEGNPAIMPDGIYDDGKFLYLDFRKNMQSLPTVFRVIDGKDTIVQYEFRDGFMIVKSMSGEGYTLRNGEKYVCVRAGKNL